MKNAGANTSHTFSRQTHLGGLTRKYEDGNTQV